MQPDNEKKLKELRKGIVKVGVLETPGSIALGLWAYAKFAANGNAFHPLLNDPEVVRFLLVIGVVILVWGSYKVVNLTMQKKKLMDDEGVH